MLPVNRVIASATFSSQPSASFSRRRRSLRTPIFFLSEEFISPGAAWPREGSFGGATLSPRQLRFRTSSCFRDPLFQSRSLLYAKWQLEIFCREVAGSSQPAPVANTHLPGIPLDHFQPAQFLNHPVGMNARNAARIRQFRLRQGNGKAKIARQVYGLQATGEFANQMRNPRNRFAPAEVGDPFPINCRFDEGFTPERLSEPRGSVQHVFQCSGCHESNHGWTQCGEIAVDIVKGEGL